ncbi:MAG: 50S ribosomal protein L22 [Gemmatimonadales bacterium]|nr:50S ribosomal protein L22 [Gemmatimonadales bacterium]
MPETPDMYGHAIQRSVRQSPRKMRLVMDLIRGKNVNEAYAILQFNKKLAAKQIAKTLKSAVANAEQHALNANENFDVDHLIVVDAQVDMGSPLKRHRAAAQGRATPIRKRTSHVKISVAEPVANKKKKAEQVAKKKADRAPKPKTAKASAKKAAKSSTTTTAKASKKSKKKTAKSSKAKTAKAAKKKTAKAAKKTAKAAKKGAK